MARGYNALGDILATTADGVDLNAIWAEHREVLALQNDARTALASLFTFPTTLAQELVPQSSGGSEFEEASEYGVPSSLRTAVDTTKVGYPLRWYDLGTRMTWRFLAEASAEQIVAMTSEALAADNRLVFKKVMQRVFNPATTVNENGTGVLGFWNGTDATPPEHLGATFDPSHTHYLVSGGNQVTSGDVDELVETVAHHGFGLRANGDRILILANPLDADRITGFRVAAGDKFDSIPTVDAPAFITPETILGDRPPGQFNGLEVACGYGDAWVVSDRQIPAGYVVALATGGPNNPRNPLGFRQHAQAGLQGLLQIPGDRVGYPLIDSYFSRGFGVGTRRRGAGAVMQLKASGPYEAPSI